MNQWEYETICTTLQSGVPALAQRLINSINTVIKSEQAATKELAELKAKISTTEANGKTEKQEVKKNGSK